MRKLITALFLLLSGATWAQVPAVQDTTATGTTKAANFGIYYKVTQYGRQYYMQNPAFGKYDMLITGNYFRKYSTSPTTTNTKLDSLYQRLVNLYDAQTVGGNKTYSGSQTFNNNVQYNGTLFGLGSTVAPYNGGVFYGNAGYLTQAQNLIYNSQFGGYLGVGNASAQTGAAVATFNSTSHTGVQLPYMTQAQRLAINISSGDNTGLTVYQTDGASGLYLLTGSNSGWIRQITPADLSGYFPYTGATGATSSTYDMYARAFGSTSYAGGSAPGDHLGGTFKTGIQVADRFHGLTNFVNNDKRNEIGTTGETESGSNTGSNFIANRYSDAGTLLGYYFKGNRLNGKIDFAASPTVPDPINPTDAANKRYVDAALNSARTQTYYTAPATGSTITTSTLQNVNIVSVTRSGVTYYSTALTSPAGLSFYFNSTAGSLKFSDTFRSDSEPVQVQYTTASVSTSAGSVPILTYANMASIVYPTANVFIVVNANEDQDGQRWIFYAPAGATDKTQLQAIASTPNTFNQ